MLLLNVFLTDKLEQKTEDVTAEQTETIAPEKEQPAASNENDTPSNETKQEKETTSQTSEKKDGYVSDWFNQANTQKKEKVDSTADSKTLNQANNELADREQTDRETNEADTTLSDNQMSDEARAEQPVLQPILPARPEQPELSFEK
ncbi:hypothetical protein [Domibacillus sp.]|uniref:hypothetical protein n=1 Tax=Domibacillus sp. TaxID=1969783 RepID=UPI002811EFB8|nr:hypothetical protein [Domibacillus sp.]